MLVCRVFLLQNHPMIVNGKTYKYGVEQLEAVDGLSHATKAKSQRSAANIELAGERFSIYE